MATTSAAPTLGLVAIPAVTGATQRDGGNAWWLRAHEFLGHLRLGHVVLTDPTGLDTVDVALLVTAECSEDGVRRLERWVRDGGRLIVAADLSHAPAALAGLAGVGVRLGGEGQVEFADDALWSRRPPRHLHALAGARLVPDAGTDLLAAWRDDGSAAVTRRALGAGTVVCFGADVWQSVSRIEQGDPVERDGVPARDGTAPVDDGILKCEDGLTLSFDDDRRMPPGEPPLPADFVHGWPPQAATPVFDLPQADFWQAAVLQALCQAYADAGVPLAWLDYWPADTPAVAHLSHDSDLNEDDDARAALDAFAEAGVRVTWCHVHPGSYSPGVHDAITAAGHENALHYNALPDQGGAWGFEHLRDQLAAAVKSSGEQAIVSNKNHYTRWEGWTEFYEWCERLGIRIDESRGPSKLGSSGFPFGTAHLSFPMADARLRNRPHDVLNLPLHTQDLGLAAHPSVRDVILDGAAAVHGVAHFLFHGPHLRRRPATRQACLDLVSEARERGMTWWTARELDAWERARRGVRIEVTTVDGGWQVAASAEHALHDAAVLLQLPAADIRLRGGTGRLHRTVRHGRELWALRCDLSPSVTHWTVEAESSRDAQRR